MTKKEIIRAPTNSKSGAIFGFSTRRIRCVALLYIVSIRLAGKKAKSKDKIIENITSGSTTESCKTPKHRWLVLKEKNLQQERAHFPMKTGNRMPRRLQESVQCLTQSHNFSTSLAVNCLRSSLFNNWLPSTRGRHEKYKRARISHARSLLRGNFVLLGIMQESGSKYFHLIHVEIKSIFFWLNKFKYCLLYLKNIPGSSDSISKEELL